MKAVKIKRTKVVEGLYRYSNGVKSIRITKRFGVYYVITNEINERHAWFKDAEERVKELLNY